MNLPLEKPFVISRGSTEVTHNVLVRLRAGEDEGLGECAPSSFYGESQQSVLETLPRLAELLPEEPGPLQTVLERLSEAAPAARSALCALDLALHDLWGKRLDAPLYELLRLDPERVPPTSYTLSIGEPERVAAEAEKSAHWPILKVKLGTKERLGRDCDIEIIERVREVYDGTIRVDANCAWETDEAVEKIYALSAYDIEFFEQPVPPQTPDGLRLVKKGCPDAIIIADESCRTAADVGALHGAVDGVNVKLVKCGGVSEALKIIYAAKALDMRTMLGCMVESSLLITAAVHVAPLVDYIDLDGALLLANDPFVGATCEQGRFRLPERPGLGVTPRG